MFFYGCFVSFYLCELRTHLIILIVEPGLKGLHHGVLCEGTLEPDQVRDLRQGGPLHLLLETPLPPPLPLRGRCVRGVDVLADADVGVVVLETVLRQG